MRANASYAFSVAGVLLIAAYFTAAGGSVDARAAIYQAMGIACAAAVLIGLWLNRPHNRRPWLLFAGGLFLWSGGDAYWNSYEWILGKAAPFPSPADGLYLAAYPLLAAGVLTLMRGWGRPKLRDLLDGLIISVSAAVVVWVVLIGPGQRGSTLSAFGTAASVGTTVGDILVFGAITQLIMCAHRKSTLALRAIGASIFLTLGSDCVYAYLNLHSGYRSGMVVDAGWLLGYTLFGAAALHPSMRSIGELPAQSAPFSRLRFAALGIALLAAPVALVVLSISSTTPDDTLVIGLGATTTMLLVAWRLWILSREREEVRAELMTRNEQLVTLNRTKDEFLASVSHELRTPLTSIRGYAELLQCEELPSDQRAYVDVIDRNSTRLAGLVEDLLLMGQIQGGRLPLELTEVALDDVVAGSREGAQPFAASRAIEVDVAGEPGIILTEGDPGRLGQALDNLLSNAIKYSSDHSTVSIRMAVVGKAATIEVTDSGMGIPADEQAKIFDRFFRTADAVHSRIQGTGLGLAITRAIVEAHGGTIGFESVAGAGTTFRITLPHARRAVAPVAALAHIG